MKPFYIIFIISKVLYSQTNLVELNFLIGTWKVDGKQMYEMWKLSEKLNYLGQSYTYKDSSKSVSETMKIHVKNDHIILNATVKGQNQGKTVSFILNNNENRIFSFENKVHDFPNKIIYSPKNDTTISVQVLSNENKGFQYLMFKQ